MDSNGKAEHILLLAEIATEAVRERVMVADVAMRKSRDQLRAGNADEAIAEALKAIAYVHSKASAVYRNVKFVSEQVN
jgi:hypothetical protein